MSDNKSQLTQEILETYDKICDAFSRLDIDVVLRYFSDSPEMTKISRGQKLRGKKELAEYWGRRLGQASDLRITIENVEVFPIDAGHVWATADESVAIAGQVQKAVVSNIFVRSGAGWKILLDHTTYLNSD
ncbi:MAG: DUF3225 domain-containing protein [Calditrichaeota bacterium]|nr:DUF3225 domain-containing protein [Calditrichota bacterium]